MEMIEEICKHCKHCLSCMCGDEFKTCKLKKSPSERALDFGKMLRSHGESEDSYTSGAAGYEMGAKEQKAIDDKEFTIHTIDCLREQRKVIADRVCTALDSIYFANEDARQRAKEFLRGVIERGRKRRSRI